MSLGSWGRECLYSCYDPVSQDPFLCTILSCATEMMCELSSFRVWGNYDIVKVDRLDPQTAEACLVCAWSDCFVTDGAGFEGRGYLVTQRQLGCGVNMLSMWVLRSLSLLLWPGYQAPPDAGEDAVWRAGRGRRTAGRLWALPGWHAACSHRGRSGGVHLLASSGQPAQRLLCLSGNAHWLMESVGTIFFFFLFLWWWCDSPLIMHHWFWWHKGDT